jgi:hypothetical protein
MNYTIIGHTEDNSYYDRCGDHISKPGKFTTLFFREEDKTAFLKAWARAKYYNTYENLLILTNGIPEDRLEDDEYYAFQDLDREMRELLPQIEAEHEEAERIRKEAAANAAVEKARQIAAQQRARDLAQLEELQRKLGVK